MQKKPLEVIEKLSCEKSKVELIFLKQRIELIESVFHRYQQRVRDMKFYQESQESENDWAEVATDATQ